MGSVSKLTKKKQGHGVEQMPNQMNAESNKCRIIKKGMQSQIHRVKWAWSGTECGIKWSMIEMQEKPEWCRVLQWEKKQANKHRKSWKMSWKWRIESNKQSTKCKNAKRSRQEKWIEHYVRSSCILIKQKCCIQSVKRNLHFKFWQHNNKHPQPWPQHLDNNKCNNNQLHSHDTINGNPATPATTIPWHQQLQPWQATTTTSIDEPQPRNTSIKVHMGFTVDFLPEGPDSPLDWYHHLLSCVLAQGKSMSVMKYCQDCWSNFLSRIFTHSLYKIFYGDKVFTCILNSAPSGIIVPG